MKNFFYNISILFGEFFQKKSAPEGALSQNQDLRGIRGFFTLSPLGQTVSLCKRYESNHPSEL